MSAMYNPLSMYAERGLAVTHIICSECGNKSLVCTHCGAELREQELVDIQDVINDYRIEHPSCTDSELKSYLVTQLDEHGVDIAISYPVIEAAIYNELFHYVLIRKSIPGS